MIKSMLISYFSVCNGITKFEASSLILTPSSHAGWSIVNEKSPALGYLRVAEWFPSYANFPASAGPFNGSRIDYRRKFTRWYNFRRAWYPPEKANPAFVSVARLFVEHPGKCINRRLRKRSIWRVIANFLLPSVLNFSHRTCDFRYCEFSSIREKHVYTMFTFISQLLWS